MTRFHLAFCFYYSAILFSALAGTYEKACSSGDSAWSKCMSLYQSYLRFVSHEALTSSRSGFEGIESYYYLYRV